ncbi:hypothetical protein B1C78_14645 [Thioalkalivibrio denitrificans]|uniref:Transcription elongation factor GreA/GreB C-terminal domain-containing protein n=1 Tax=Thioalkalivibrio denitrificans TaxID=108003 RepID=A0A1V3NCK2_9GAMM|nr:hypothetical protein B1C78_14645 [Thioalkalivibrio denitrificans]
MVDLSRILTGLQTQAPEDPAMMGLATGDVVELLSMDDGSEARIELVESDADGYRPGTATLTSPLGSVLVGRRPAELVEVRFMGRRMRFLILRVLWRARDATAARRASKPRKREAGRALQGQAPRSPGGVPASRGVVRCSR